MLNQAWTSRILLVIVLGLVLVMNFGCGLADKTYMKSCDTGLRDVPPSSLLATFSDKTRRTCSFACLDDPFCRSFDLTNNGTCHLMNTRSYSGCLSASQTDHYALVNIKSLLSFLLHFNSLSC